MNLDPIVLDLDGSVGCLPREKRFVFSDWQERLRYGCSMRDRATFAAELQRLLPSPDSHGPVFFGSGDFHHLTHSLVDRLIAGEGAPIEVVVLDNHPDNMRFPLGTHCGSWVAGVAALPGVSQVHVVGITSSDVGWMHALEHHFGPLLSGRLVYWCVRSDAWWTGWAGLKRAVRMFEGPDRLVAGFTRYLAASGAPLYLSVDKDVFAPDVVRTNWDQGRLRVSHAGSIIAAMEGRLVGSDITGDVSIHHYKTRWKRWLSRLDGQRRPTDAELLAWRGDQNALDLRLLQLVVSAFAR